MKYNQSAIIVSLAFILVLLGCQSGPCKGDPTTKLEAPEAIANSIQAGAATSPTKNQGAAKAAPDSNDKSKTTWVFKYDGSKQCGMGNAVSAEVMEKELKGIPVLARKSENDGMMRTMVCGAATGQANLFQISISDLKTAESLGFKLWPPKRP